MDALVQLATTRRRAPPVDVALAGGLLAWALLEAALVDGPGPAWARYLAAVAFSVPFAWRRRAPVAVLLVVVGTLVLRAATTAGAETGAMPFPALLLGAFSVALYARPAWLAIACAPLPMVGFGAATALGYVDGEPTPVDMAILSFISLGAWTGGWVVRRRAAALAQAEAAAPVLAREAVAAERERWPASCTTSSPTPSRSSPYRRARPTRCSTTTRSARASTCRRSAGRTAHEALVELRRLLGVLREEDPRYRPQPGLEDLDELVAEARRGGLRVAHGRGRRVAAGSGDHAAARRALRRDAAGGRRAAARALRGADRA